MKFPTHTEWRTEHLPRIIAQESKAYHKSETLRAVVSAEASQVADEFYPQSVALHQFTECDEEGKPMVKPYEGLFEVEKHYVGCMLLNTKEEAAVDGPRYYHKGKYLKAVKEFEVATQRVLFEGWQVSEELIQDGKTWFSITNEANEVISFSDGGLILLNNEWWTDNIDCLVHKIDLTPTQSVIQTLKLRLR